MAAEIYVGPQKGPQYQFLTSSADIAIFGGAAGGGKSYALLLEGHRHRKTPGFTSVIFRRTYPMLKAPGGLWDQSMKLYPLLGGTPSLGDVSWQWPSGAKLKFSHLQHSTSVLDWYGSELALIGYDELTQFEEGQFWTLLSRNRSLCGIKPFIRATCNPDADSWVASLLEWWIDQSTGLPIPERAGVLRWFVRVNDRLVWADSREELRRLHPDIPSKSLTFVPARLSDNAALMAADPGYLANLLALSLVERERLLGGNWKIKPAAGLIFNRAWFDLVEAAPREAQRIRAWDKAGVSGGGDCSAGVKIARDMNGVYYVEDVVRGQWSALDRNRVIKTTAQLDGDECEVWLEQEPGSGGKESAEISVRELAGFLVHVDRPTGDKVTRARQFAAQCEARNVKLVRGPWNAVYLDELHGFPERTQDDMVDASALSFNKLAVAYIGGWDATPSPDSLDDVAKAPPGVFRT